MKKAKKIAIVFAILLLIAGVAFGAVYYFTDIFKTPQEAFYSYLDKAAKIDNSNNYQEMLEALKASQTKSYKSETSMGIEINTRAFKDMEAQQALNLLKNLKLNVNSNVKPSEKKSTSTVSLSLGNFNAGNLKLVRDGDMFGIKSELLDNKYLAVENNNLKDLLKKFGADTTNVPNKLQSLDLYDLLYISKDDQFNLEKTYRNIFKDNIPAENFTKEENVTQKINGQDVNTTAYKLSLNEKDFINVMVKLLETAEKDETLLNIITEKFNKLIENGMFDSIDVSSSYSLPSTSRTKKLKITEKISVETLRSALDSLIKEFKEEGEYASSSKAEIIVYAANNDIAKVEVKTANEVQLSMDFFNKDDKKHIVLYAKQDSYSYNAYKSYNSYKDLYAMPKNKSELTKIMEIEYKSSKGFNDRTLNAGFTIFRNNEQVAKVLFDITTKGKAGQGTNETNSKITLEKEEASISLLIDSKIEYTDNVNVESIDKNNANILNDMSEKEIQKYFEDIVEGFEDTFSMFGINNNIKTKNKSWLNESYDDIDTKKETIDEEELEKQIQELNEKLKELQESNT